MDPLRSEISILRIGAISAIICGLCDILGGFLVIISFFIPVIPSLVWGIVFAIANVLLIFPIIAISLLLSEKGGCMIKAGYILSITGLLFALSGFFPPSGWLVFLIGIFILTLVNMNYRKVSRTAMWLWFISILVSLGLVYLDIPLLNRGVMPILSSIPLIWIGISLQTKPETHVS